MNARHKRMLFVIGGAVAFLAAVALVAVYLVGIPQGGGMLARLQSGFSSVTGGASKGAGQAPQEFAFRRLEIDVSKPQAEACLVFTRALDASEIARLHDAGKAE